MFCRYCGKQILDGSAFCSHCGKSLVDAPVKENLDDLDLSLDPNVAKQEVTPSSTASRPISVLSLVGFILSIASYFMPLLEISLVLSIPALVLSIICVVRASKQKQRLKGLGIAGIAVAGSLIFLYGITVLTALIGFGFEIPEYPMTF